MEDIATALDLSLEKIIDADEVAKRKIQIANYLDYMEENGACYRELEGIDIAGLIYDKVEFQKRVKNGIKYEELNTILRGTFNISKEDKINLSELMFDEKISRELEIAEKQIKKDLMDMLQASELFEWEIFQSYKIMTILVMIMVTPHYTNYKKQITK